MLRKLSKSRFSSIPEIIELNSRFPITGTLQMPIIKLHLQNFDSLDGKPYTDPELLFRGGCWLRITVINASQKGENGLFNIDSPDNWNGYAMVDTGSHTGSILGDLADKLGIKGVMKDVSGGGVGMNKQEVAPSMNVMFDGLDLFFPLHEITIIRGKAQEDWKSRHGNDPELTYGAMVGREFLANCKMVYDGLKGEVVLETFDKPEQIESAQT